MKELGKPLLLFLILDSRFMPELGQFYQTFSRFKVKELGIPVKELGTAVKLLGDKVKNLGATVKNLGPQFELSTGYPTVKNLGNK